MTAESSRSKLSRLTNSPLAAVCATITAAWALLVLARIDSGMARVHKAAQASYGIHALSGRLFGGAADVNRILGVWHDSAAGTLHDEVMAWRNWYALVNVLLVLGYVGLLRFLLLFGLPIDPEQQPDLKSIRVLAIWLLPIALAVETLELLLERFPDPGTAWFLWSVTHVKWLLAAGLTVLALVLAIPAARDRLHESLALAGRLRVQLAALVALGVFLLVPITDQAPDMLRRMVEDWTAWIAVPLALMLLASVLYLSDASSYPAELKDRKRTPPWLLLVIGAVFIGVSFAPHVVRLRAAGLIIGAIYLIGGLAGEWWKYTALPSRYLARSSDALERHLNAERRLPKARYGVAVAPLVIATLALGSAETDPALFGTRTWAHRVALGLSLPLALLAVAVTARRSARHNPTPSTEAPTGWRQIVVWRRCVYTLTLAVAAWLAFSHRLLPRFLGGLGVIAVALAVLVLGLTLLQRRANRLAPPRGLRVLGFRRVPLLTLLAVWLLLASVVDTQGPNEIRTGRPPAAPAAAVDVRTAFAEWASRCATAGKPTPLVLVSASGGGIRAAYWTAAVLNRLAPPTRSAGSCGPAQKVFAASGTSGSALGLIGYSTQFDASGPDADKAAEWPWSVFGEDYLAPTLAAMFLRDLPAAFAFDGGYDRAQALEDSWTQSNKRLKAPFVWGRDASNSGPLLILNGTTTNGCRLTVSPLDLGNGEAARCSLDTASTSPGDLDAARVLCGRQISRATAALLSARFAYVSPSGALPGCGDNASVRVVDGGYSDNSGGQSLADLYTHDLEPAVRKYNSEHPAACVLPVWVHLSNGYQATTPTVLGRRPGELTAPLSTASAVRDQLDKIALQRAMTAMGDDVGCTGNTADGHDTQRFFTVQPSEHPGVQAPLGWTLSHAARADLDRQLSAIDCMVPWKSDDHAKWERLVHLLSTPECSSPHE